MSRAVEKEVKRLAEERKKQKEAKGKPKPPDPKVKLWQTGYATRNTLDVFYNNLIHQKTIDKKRIVDAKQIGLRVAHTLRRKTVRWQLEDDMDQHVAGVADEKAEIQLCDWALSKLNPELAEAFVLYEIEGLSSPEIAALLEVPLGSVASRLLRAREQFRAAIARAERNLRRWEKRRVVPIARWAMIQTSLPACAPEQEATSSDGCWTPPLAKNHRGNCVNEWRLRSASRRPLSPRSNSAIQTRTRRPLSAAVRVACSVGCPRAWWLRG